MTGLGIFRETAPRPETEAVLSAFDFGGIAGWWMWAAAEGGRLRLRTPGAYALLLELSAEGIAHLHCAMTGSVAEVFREQQATAAQLRCGDDPASPYESGCSWRRSRAPCSTPGDRQHVQAVPAVDQDPGLRSQDGLGARHTRDVNEELKGPGPDPVCRPPPDRRSRDGATRWCRESCPEPSAAAL